MGTNVIKSKLIRIQTNQMKLSILTSIVGSIAGTALLVSGDNTVTYKITVESDLPDAIDVYFFNSPALFNDNDATFVNSLATKVVQPKKRSQATFTFSQKNYAAALNHNGVQSGPVTANSIAIMPISFGKYTDLDIDKNGDPFLNTPRDHEEGEHPTAGGSFIINVPTFPALSPTSPEYHIGLGAIVNDRDTITSFIKPLPGMTYTVQPVVKFYIQVGSKDRHDIVNFTGSSATAAVCDASTGAKDFFVTRRMNGTWTVTAT